MGRDEPQEQPVEQRRRVNEHRAQPIGAERAAPGDCPELGEERAAGGDEQPDRLGQAQCRPRPGAGRGRRSGGGAGLGFGTAGVVVGVEVGDERRDEAAAVGPERLAARRPGWPRGCRHRGRPA